MKTSIRKGDTVIVLSGKNRGRQGRVLEVNRNEGTAIVEHVNMVHKHRKARSANDQGGIITMEAPIALCKLALVSDDAPTRVRIEETESGGKRRISTRTGKPIDS